jgi:ATP-dependent RNA helicase RhlE
VQAFEVAAGAKHQALHRLLSKEAGRCLVFARTKRGTERVAKRLKQDGFSVAMIHGDRSQSQRTAALSGFQQGRFRVLVATDVASRGIHVQDIAHVINYDLPKIAEDFIHRVGRTGRAGEQGLASTLVQGDELMELRDIERTLGIRMEWKHAESDLPARQERKSRESADLGSLPAASGRRMVRLPGEILQKHGDTV